MSRQLGISRSSVYHIFEELNRA
ncbi:hypothetical protein [Eilatimonas milleporae]